MRFFQHLIILTMAMVVSGLFSIAAGKELGWDLANYHYYHPYAILHGRSYFDFWPPSFVHQYINPTLDFLSYFLITYLSPSAVEFTLGAIHGINFWLLFVIARLFMRKSMAFCVALLGMYGPSALYGIGSFQNDNLISLFVLSSVLIYLKGLLRLGKNTAKNELSYFISASLLLGIGTGLKLTAGIFVPGIVFATLTLPITFLQRLKLLLLITLFISVGLLISSGYWMYLMWEMHHSPFFPFLNNIFHSPDSAIVNWRDTRFLPQGIWQTLFFPFYFSWDGRTADGGFRDFRFAMVYVLVMIISFFYFLKIVGLRIPQKNNRLSQAKHDKKILYIWLLTFFIFSYIAWQVYFSIARYLTPLEMLAPLLIYLLVQQMPVRPYWHAATLMLLFYLLFFFMSPIMVVRAPWYQTTFFNVKLPDSVFKKNEALVLMAYSVYMKGKPWLDANPRPQAYLIPYFPSQWRFVGIPFGHEKYLEDTQLAQKIHQLIQTPPQPIYLLTSDVNMLELYRAAHSFGLTKAGACEKIFSDRQKMTGQAVLLCPVKQF